MYLNIFYLNLVEKSFLLLSVFCSSGELSVHRSALAWLVSVFVYINIKYILLIVYCCCCSLFDVFIFNLFICLYFYERNTLKQTKKEK